MRHALITVENMIEEEFPTSTQSSVFVSGELENFWKNRSKEAKKQHTRENFNSSSVEKIYNFFLGTFKN